MATTTTTLLPLPSEPVAQGLTNRTYWVLDADRTVTWAIADAPGDASLAPIAQVAVPIVNDVLAKFSDVADIRFSFAGYFPDVRTTPANIVVTATEHPQWFLKPSGVFAWAFFPDEPMTDSQIAALFGTSSAYPNAAGDVFLNFSEPSVLLSTFQPGSNGYFILMHELGHALGLKHPHDDGGTGSPTFADLGLSIANTQLLTIMSYEEGTSIASWLETLNLPADYGYPSSLMPLDVIALQSIYGPNTTTRSGDTTYYLANDAKLETIWDAGGRDLLTAEASVWGWRITVLDNFAGHSLTTALPEGTLLPTGKTYFDVENITGSQFADYVQGGSADNVIQGLAGADLLFGGGGNDVVSGGDGNDDEYGEDGNDALLGGPGNDRETGGAGDDTFDSDPSSRGGDDLFIGGQGNDIYYFFGNDQIVENPSEGVDTVWVQVNSSLANLPYVENIGALPGTGGISLTGNAANNIIAGNESSNLLFGGGGNDTIDGGAGFDGALYANSRSGYTVAKTGSTFTVSSKNGAEGTDVLRAIEALAFSDKTFSLVGLPRTHAPDYGKDNGFLFDGVFYLLANSELVPTVTLDNALQSYFTTGAAQHLKPNSWFDAAYYSAKWADLAPLLLDDATLFMHYNLYGVWEGRSAGPKFDHFDGNRYLKDWPDVAAYVDANLPAFLGSRTNGAIAHFIIYGANEQRTAYDTVGAAVDMGYVV